MGESANDHFQLLLMGSWQLLRNGVSLNFPAREQRLIAALAVYGPRPRSYLSGLLWPNSPEARALESLRVTVHLITRQVPGLLLHDRATLSLDKTVTVDLDQVRAQIRMPVEGTGTGLEARLELLRDAELLPGWYDDWVVFEQTRLRNIRLHIFQVMAREALVGCNYELAAVAAEAALELEPICESAVQLLILAELRQGNHASAVRAFRRYESQAREDFGVTPSRAIRELVAGILAG